MSKSGRFSKELYPILRKKTEVLGLQQSLSHSTKGQNTRNSTLSVSFVKSTPTLHPESCFFRSQSRQDRDRALLSKDKVPSSLQYYAQFTAVHRRNPAFAFPNGRPQTTVEVDTRELPTSTQIPSKTLCDFKHQLPRKPNIGTVNDHRFAKYSEIPQISTKSKRIRAFSLSKQPKRKQLFVNCPSLLLSYEPKFSQVELDLGKNGLDMARSASRLPLTLGNLHDLQYQRPQSAEHIVSTVKMDKSLSRPELKDSTLPVYMRKVPSRLGVTCLIDKALRMNSSLNLSDTESSSSDLG